MTGIDLALAEVHTCPAVRKDEGRRVRVYKESRRRAVPEPWGKARLFNVGSLRLILFGSDGRRYIPRRLLPTNGREKAGNQFRVNPRTAR
jgi:hypothetical protein